jgi:hypothetical protein
VIRGRSIPPARVAISPRAVRPSRSGARAALSAAQGPTGDKRGTDGVVEEIAPSPQLPCRSGHARASRPRSVIRISSHVVDR